MLVASYDYFVIYLHVVLLALYVGRDFYFFMRETGILRLSPGMDFELNKKSTNKRSSRRSSSHKEVPRISYPCALLWEMINKKEKQVLLACRLR